MKIIPVIVLLIITFENEIHSQLFVGLKSSEVIQQLNAERHFHQETNFKNDTYKYLKFYNRSDEETLIVFLTYDDRVRVTRLMSDYSNLDNRTKELNRNYKKVRQNCWVGTRDGKEYLIELKKEDWYFTLTTKEKK